MNFFGSVNRSEVFASGRRRNEFDLEPEFALHFNNGKVHFQPVEVEHYSLNTFDRVLVIAGLGLVMTASKSLIDVIGVMSLGALY